MKSCDVKGGYLCIDHTGQKPTKEPRPDHRYFLRHKILGQVDVWLTPSEMCILWKVYKEVCRVDSIYLSTSFPFIAGRQTLTFLLKWNVHFSMNPRPPHQPFHLNAEKVVTEKLLLFLLLFFASPPRILLYIDLPLISTCPVTLKAFIDFLTSLDIKLLEGRDYSDLSLFFLL